jgi:large subunit ribosomal protein L18
MLEKTIKRQRRHKRIRAKISGVEEKPRLCVFRSAKHIYLQLINDQKGEVLISANDKELKKNSAANETELEKKLKGKEKKAFLLGKLLAKKAEDKKIVSVVFDRGGYAYHGRVKAAADGAREGGLKF